EKLAQTHIRQLKERITHSFCLDPFPPDDILQYLNFRLRAVGYRGPDLFSGKTAAVIKKYSGGLTRRINILADKALLAAFSEGSHSVTSAHIKTAAIDSEFAAGGVNKKVVWVAGGVMVAIGVLFIGVLIGQSQSGQPGATAEKRPAGSATEVVAAAEQNNSAEIPGAAVSEPQAPGQRKALAHVAERVASSRSWLAKAADNHFSIQLFMAPVSDAAALESFLQKLPSALDISKVYIYETRVNGRAWYSVLYDEFATQQDAIASLKQLPASLKSSSPYLRRLAAIKNDLVTEAAES
ncbi:MAG TPA: hypothetical protein ENJ64_03340, partial [Thiotrichales bacterium]|nr:hypothetical protein [Thiotrichales bacterium]